MNLLDLLNLDLSNLGTNGLIAIIAVSVISAAAYVWVAWSNRHPPFHADHLQRAIGTLIGVRDQLIDPKVRVQIVDFATGRVLLEVPRTTKDWSDLIEFLHIRHLQNLHVVGRIRFCLTRRQKRRLDRAARQVENKRLKVVRLFARLRQMQSNTNETRVQVLAERIMRGIVAHINSVVRFEQLVLIAIQSSLDHYSEKLEGV